MVGQIADAKDVVADHSARHVANGYIPEQLNKSPNRDPVALNSRCALLLRLKPKFGGRAQVWVVRIVAHLKSEPSVEKGFKRFTQTTLAIWPKSRFVFFLCQPLSHLRRCHRCVLLAKHLVEKVVRAVWRRIASECGNDDRLRSALNF